MFMSNSKRFNKLKHKSTYVNLEYEDVLDEFNTARLECVKAIKKFCEDMNRVSPIVEDNEMKEKLNNKEISEEDREMFQTDELKALYRKIAQKCHPDVLGDEFTKEMEEYYISATEAKDNCDISILLNIAANLNVEGSDLSEEQLNHLESNIDNKEIKIEEMKSHFMYKWFLADENTKNNIFWQICPPINPTPDPENSGND